MSWVLEHIQVIIAVAAAIAYVLNQRRKAAPDEAESPRQASDASEQAERTRRVQEEIRRKIAERRGASSAPDVAREATPPPLLHPPAPAPSAPLDPFGGPMRRVLRKLEEAAAAREVPLEDEATKAVLQRQAQLREQMRALEAARQEEQRRAAAVEARAVLNTALTKTAVPRFGDLHDRLRDPQELRRAILLRELLGPPLALRPRS